MKKKNNRKTNDNTKSKKGNCQTKRETYGSPLDKGFRCQFEGLYRNITDKEYSDFYKDFFQHNDKHYCPFHAPMDAKKLSGEHSERTKKEVLSSSYLDEGIEEKSRILYLKKFYNVIYGVINQQSVIFSERFNRDDYRRSNEEQIDFQEIIFPGCLSLTKDKSGYGEEYEKYSKDLNGIIPFINFSNCEFRGLEAKSGTISDKTYPDLTINGASFFNSSFTWNLELIGVNFAPEKQHNFDVTFDRANFQCTTIKFTGSKFCTLSLKNAKIHSAFIEFNSLCVHGSFDISCDYEAAEDVKKIKFPSGDFFGVYFSGSSFGDESTYKKIRTSFAEENGNDAGGKMICRNRIFERDVYFNSCRFYQAPDFFGTRFERMVNFEFSEFLPSSFKYKYHSFYRIVKSEMERLNLYREERIFWRYEEKCLEEPSVTLESWKGIPVDKPLSFLTKFLFKKDKNKKSEFFFTYHGFFERSFSKLFEIICERGTSFRLIITGIILLPFVIFPSIYLISDSIFWSFVKNCWSSNCVVNYSDFSQFFDLFAKKVNASVFYTTHPFSAGKEVSELKEYKLSLQLLISYLQSIVQITIYVIFGFMLRKRFRMSGG